MMMLILRPFWVKLRICEGFRRNDRSRSWARDSSSMSSSHTHRDAEYANTADPITNSDDKTNSNTGLCSRGSITYKPALHACIYIIYTLSRSMPKAFARMRHCSRASSLISCAISPSSTISSPKSVSITSSMVTTP